MKNSENNTETTTSTTTDITTTTTPVTNENLQHIESESNGPWITHFGCSLQSDNKSIRMSSNILSRSSTVSSSMIR